MSVSDAQFAAFVDRVVACREAEDRAKEDTKAFYAEISDAGEDKTAIGVLVRELRMTAKDRTKANLKANAVHDASVRYQRGKASHVRVREASVPEHDADGVIIKSGPTAGASQGGTHETHGIANDPISSVAAMAAVIVDDDMADGAGSIAGGGSDVSASDVEPVAPHSEPEAALLPQTVVSRDAGAGHADAGQATVEGPATIHEPAPLVVGVAAVGGGGANPPVASAAVTIADISKPNPICRDPGDCGVYASWHLPCEACKVAAAHRSAA